MSWSIHDPYCEHCGDLERFDLTYSSDGTSWCEDCADAAEPPAKLLKAQRTAKQKYFAEKYEEWTDEH